MFGAESRKEIALIRTTATGELISTSDAVRLAVSYLAEHIRRGAVGNALVDRQAVRSAPDDDAPVRRDPVEESGL